MPRYIRDKEGNLHYVQFETDSFYYCIRVKDKAVRSIPIKEAKPVERVDAYPGDWAIGFQ